MAVLEVSRQGRVERLTLNRPEKRNALSHELASALAGALDAASADNGVGAILIEAAEGPAFCAGMDLDDASSADAVARTAIHERLFTIGERIRKPIVAAVAGSAFGGGLGILANAHIVVAAHGASFGLTEIRLGMWPFFIWRCVVNAVGHRRATELALTGRLFGPNEAAQYGLVHEVVPPIELDDRATAIAELLAGFSPFTTARGLELASASRSLDAAATLSFAAQLRGEVFASPDFAEGVRALREKRAPVWPSIPPTS